MSTVSPSVWRRGEWPAACSACGEPIDFAGNDWRPLASRQVIHYGGKRELDCYQANLERAMEREPEPGEVGGRRTA